LKIEYVESPSFDLPGATDEALEPFKLLARVQGSGKDMPKPPSGTPPYLSALYAIPLLTHPQEQSMFRAMNFLKHRADRLRQEIDPDCPPIGLMDQIEQLLDDALRLRNYIVQANLRLVVSIAKTLVDDANSFDDLVSDGNVPLIRAVVLFDFDRGTRFSTYATWAVRNSLYRATTVNRRRQTRYVTVSEPSFDSVAEHRLSELAQVSRWKELQTTISQMVSGLDARDQVIVKYRFGLGDVEEPQRFREIAERLNISTERVRQLLTRALKQLRTSSIDAESALAEWRMASG